MPGIFHIVEGIQFVSSTYTRLTIGLKDISCLIKHSSTLDTTWQILSFQEVVSKFIKELNSCKEIISNNNFLKAVRPTI